MAMLDLIPHHACRCRTLNRIQSRIYRTAMYSNENVLVCAPTGAGKTNIAMIAILREVAANMQQGQIRRQDFKIVYVAPMKALAAEQTATFSRRLADLGASPLPIHPSTGVEWCCPSPFTPALGLGGLPLSF